MGTGEEHFDALIIGGGVIGLSAAWELARHGLKVCVVDKSELGREASWAASGMIPPGPRPARWPECSASERLAGFSSQLRDGWFSALAEATGNDCEFRIPGAIYLPDPRFADTLGHWNRWAVEYQPLQSDELRSCEPHLLAAEGILQLEEAQVRPPRYLQALQSACDQLGVVMRPHCEVRGFRCSGNAVSEVVTSEGKLSADKYCLAAGCWSEAIVRDLGLRLPMKAVRGQIALLHGPPGYLRHIINVGRCYLTPRLDGRVLVGSTQEEVGFDKSCTAEGIRSLLDFALKLVPGLKNFTLEQIWAGLRPAAADELPVLGPVPGVSNAWVATGHFRAGIQLAPATACVLRAMLLGEQLPIEVEELRPARFLDPNYADT